MRYQSVSRCLKTIFPLLVLVSGALLTSCGEKMRDPEEFYTELVKAARERDGGFMYDVLDSTRRASIDTLIGMQMANLDKLPPTERARWDSLKGKSKREIYAKILTSDKGLTDIFNTDYKVLKVDTLIVMKIQHTGQEPNTVYLSPRSGSYEIVEPPRPPAGAMMPEGHPGMDDPQGGAPGTPPQGGAPQGGAPGTGAPNGGGTAPKK